MEKCTLLKYKKLVEYVLDNDKLPTDIDFTLQESSDIFRVTRDFYNLVCYDACRMFHDKRILKDAFLKGEFLVDKIMVDSNRYQQLKNRDQAVKNLKEGETIYVVDNNATEDLGVKCQTKYSYVSNCILVKFVVGNLKDIDKKVFHNVKLSQLENLNNSVTHYDENGNLRIPMEGGKEAVAVQVGSDVEVNFHDENKNPCKKHNFRLYGKTKEITHYDETDFVQLYKNMRLAKAHHNMYEYGEYESYAGKLFLYNNGAVLMSNIMQDSLYSLVKGPYHGYANQLRFIYVPRNPAIRYGNNQELLLDQKLNSCKIVTIDSTSNMDIYETKVFMHDILDAYANQTNMKISLEGYVSKELESKGYADFKITTDNIPNTDILKSRLLNKEFCNMSQNEKELIANQNYVMRQIVEDIYGYSMVNEAAVSKSGKFSAIDINMKDFYEYLNLDCDYIYQIAKKETGKKARELAFAKNERYVCMCMFLAYNALVRNNFLDKINEYELSATKYYVDNDAVRGGLKSKLMSTKMDMFEIRTTSKKEGTKPIDLGSRMAVLRAIRNSVAHNNLKIKYTKTGKIQDATFVFPFAKTTEEVRVSTKDFLEFISNPLFLEYNEDHEQQIVANDDYELTKKIIELCNKTNNSDDDFSSN